MISGFFFGANYIALPPYNHLLQTSGSQHYFFGVPEERNIRIHNISIQHAAYLKVKQIYKSDP